MKDRFIQLQLKALFKRPLTEEGVKDALYNAWDNGASTALLLPGWAYSEVGGQFREAYARLLLGVIALNDYNDLYGVDPGIEELAGIIDRHIKEEKIVPFLILAPELTPISEERSRN